MSIIVFNLPGIIIVAAAIGIAFGIGELTGHNSDDAITLVGGALTLVLDLAYRLLRKEGHWLRPNQGGSLFFLPAWCFGALWVVLGIVRMLYGG
jgi:hypothetical protein